jgi:hypothetical protein
MAFHEVMGFDPISSTNSAPRLKRASALRRAWSSLSMLRLHSGSVLGETFAVAAAAIGCSTKSIRS